VSPFQCLKVVAVELEEMAVARQRLAKHDAAESDAIEELLNAVFSVRSIEYQILRMLGKGK
jgi:hypothetical protein